MTAVHIDFYTTLTALGAVASALLAIWSLTTRGRGAWKKWWIRRKQKRQMPGLLLSIKEELQKVSDRQEFFASELKTNGGSSLKDEVRLLVSERLMELQEAPYPAFRCTSNGEAIFVNRAYETLVDDDDSKLVGLGWQSFVFDSNEGDNYYQRWLQIAKTGSHFAGNLRYKDSHGKYRGEWFVRIVPLGPYKAHNQIWGGRFYPEDEKAQEIAKEYGWAR